MEEWRERGRGGEGKGERKGGGGRKRERPPCLESYNQEEFFLSSKALDQPSMEIPSYSLNLELD